MSERRFEPEEFERLLGLPEDHPERVRAERSGRLSAWKQMLGTFESPSDPLMTPSELAAAEAELERRVAQAMSRDPSRAPARPRAPASSMSWLRGWTTGGGRMALAFASVAIVAVAGWWSIERLRGTSAVRSVGGETVEVSAAPVSGGIELRWRAVAGARIYRVLFYGSDLTELARVDSLQETRLALRADHLPPGLVSGQSVLVDVTAVLPYDQITSKTIAIVVP